MKLQFVLALAFLGAGLSAAAPAAATVTYNFSMTGSETLSFSLPASPTPSIIDPGAFFVLSGISGTYNNVVATFDLGFGSPSYAFNFGLLSPTAGGSGFVSQGLSMYTGSEAAPTFTTGSFTLSDGNIMTISLAGAVPEPASWAMMITGMGALGITLRSRRRRTVAA